MKKVKKFIIALVVILVICGAVSGAGYAYMSHQKSTLTAEVFNVSSLNFGFSSDAMTSSGYVTNDHAQNIYTNDKTVTKIHVAVGDAVEIGDPIIEFDTTSTDLQLEMKKLEIQGIVNDITIANRELEKLNNTTPVPEESDDDLEDEPEEKVKPEEDDFVIQVEQKNGDAYNYVDKNAKAYKGKGTKEDPYRFLCTSTAYVTGSYLNSLVQNEEVAAFEVWSRNDRENGTLEKCWTVNGSKFGVVGEESHWSVDTESEIFQEAEELPDDTEEDTEEDTEISKEITYTEKELKEAIREKKATLQDLDIDKRTAELGLKKLEKTKEGSVVLATVKGNIKSVGDPENPPIDNSPFIEISGSEGLYVTGSVSELMLDKIKNGQVVTANSWNTGLTFNATITEISEYPSNNNNYYGEGNSNVSYYPFTAYIEDATGLKNGDYVDLSMMPQADVKDENGIYLEKAYVRQEDGKSYVLKVGKDNCLVKQYVETGKTVYGSAVEIKSGLAMEDRIAFPYGKTAKEGIKAIDSSGY